MKQQPFVTIAIPVKNGADFLDYTLTNVFLSDYPGDRYEVIVGNHGSTDSSRAIIDTYLKKHPNIKAIDIEYDGPNRPRARNRIIDVAQGEIIIFIDQDILISANFINEHLRIHEEYPGSLVAGYTFGKGMISQVDAEALKYLNLKNITQDYDLLKSKASLKDTRETAKYIQGTGPMEDLSETISPFRIFWSCNLSVRKIDLDELGGFDENYTEWGLEDDDLAYRYQLRGRKMIFSNLAWSYHMSHPVMTTNNISSWRRNRGYFFRKFGTRELELFTVYTGHMKIGFDEIQFHLDVFPKDAAHEKHIEKIAAALPKRQGKRLGIYMRKEEDALRLDLTHCFIPFKPMNTQKYTAFHCTFWGLMGFVTPFEKQEFDEIIIPADTVMFLDDFLIKILMTECARITKKAILFYGALTKEPAYQYLVDTLNWIADCTKFVQLERVIL